MVDIFEHKKDIAGLINEELKDLKASDVYSEHLSNFKDFISTGDSGRLLQIANFFAEKYSFNLSLKDYIPFAKLIDTLTSSDPEIYKLRDCRLATFLLKDYFKLLQEEVGMINGNEDTEIDITIHYTPILFLHPYLLVRHNPIDNSSERKLTKLDFKAHKFGVPAVAEMGTITKPILVDGLQTRMRLPDDILLCERAFDTYGQLSTDVEKVLKYMHGQARGDMRMKESNDLIHKTHLELDLIKDNYLNYLSLHGFKVFKRDEGLIRLLSTIVEDLIVRSKPPFFTEEFDSVKATEVQSTSLDSYSIGEDLNQ